MSIEIAALEVILLTKCRLRVLLFYPLTPVLAEEHVCGKSAFGCIGILLSFARAFLSGLLGGFALIRVS